MGRALLYMAWAIMIIGVIVERFVHEFPNEIFIPFLVFCILLGVIGYLLVGRGQNHRIHRA